MLCDSTVALIIVQLFIDFVSSLGLGYRKLGVGLADYSFFITIHQRFSITSNSGRAYVNSWVTNLFCKSCKKHNKLFMFDHALNSKSQFQDLHLIYKSMLELIRNTINYSCLILLLIQSLRII
jgi:hypothetical protein